MRARISEENGGRFRVGRNTHKAKKLVLKNTGLSHDFLGSVYLQRCICVHRK